MGKIATIAAGLALFASQAAFAQGQAAAQPAGDPATQSAPNPRPGHAGGGFGHAPFFSNPGLIAASLAGLSALTIGIVVAADSNHHSHPTSP